jgi:hypothetical protein
MGEHLAIEERIAQAETRWPGLRFKRKSASEASSACPFCRQAVHDGFLIFSSGSYWCRKCDAKGFIDENDPTPPDPVKLLEARLSAVEREQKAQAKRLTALERMARCTDHLRYHEQLNHDMRDLWYEKGVGDHLIDAYQLGLCYHCKTDQPEERMSLTIPVTVKGVLKNIRHRLLTNENDRYRPHRSGLGNMLFGADDVYSDDVSSILVIEGEIKRIVVKDRLGGNVVGTMGKAGFQKKWASRFSHFGEVLICLDPDAEDKARELAGWFGDRGRVVGLGCKPDDFFTLYNGTTDQFREYLRLARRIQ